MEIFVNNERIDLENLVFKNYREQTSFLKTQLEEQLVDFPILKQLNGNKEILNLCFKDTKKELI